MLRFKFVERRCRLMVTLRITKPWSGTLILPFLPTYGALSALNMIVHVVRSVRFLMNVPLRWHEAQIIRTLSQGTSSSSTRVATS